MRKSLATVVAIAVAIPLVLNCNDPLQPRTREQGQRERPSLAVGAAVGGSWAPPFTWPIISGHLGVLPDGRVISWMSGYVTGDLERHHVYVWNPTTGAFTELTDGTENIFCSGNAFFPDGRLLVPGGHISDSKGLKETYIFDWRSNAWTEVSTMRAGRWYPTTTALANGTLTTVGGTEEDGLPNMYPELWNGSGWKVLRGARLNMLYYYPWMHPAPDGRVFNSGPDGVTRYLNPSGGGEWTLGPRSKGGLREYGGSIMYAPGKILIVGGGDPPTNTAETIDLNTGGAWQPTGSMQFRRRQMNSTVLPNGRVLVMGGTSGAGFNNESQPVLTPEMWNPQTGTWSTLNNLQVPRLYHSAAVLLPDGRVLIGGGGRCDGCTDHPDAQIFSPPYLFATNGTPAVRPTISSAPTSVSYGQTFAVQTPDVSAITRVTWVRLPIATHTFNQNQWINELTFTKTTGASRLNVATPANAYLAPPGHYMLFILNSSGVPSVAKIVQLQGSAALPPAPAKPPAPSRLLASSVDDQRIQLAWADNSNSETDFLVERCLGSGCTNFEEIAQLEPQTTRYLMASLAKGTTYTFRVRARNEAGYSAYSNSAVGSTTSGETVAVRTLVSQLANKCVEDDGGGQLNATRIFIMPCSGATKQQWITPPPGYPGDIRIFSTMCIDAYSAQGNPGDRIELWECSGGANQQWTLNSAGELKGINGLCIALNGGATADSTRMAIQPCTGDPSQKWKYGTADGNLPPVAAFSYQCTDLTCDFSDSSTDDGSVVEWSWDFGDAAGTSSIRNPSYTFTRAGSYQVKLTVADDTGATTSITQTVTVTSAATNTAPSAAFTSNCSNLACTFLDGSTDPDGSVTSWSWSFGDGGTSTTQNPNHSYAAAGTYDVTLTATDNGGASAAKTISLTVTAAPPGNVSPTASFTSKCTDLTCTFTDGSTDSDGTVTGWSWTFGEGGTSTSQSPTYTYAAAGTYDVALTATDNEGATGVKSATVTVSSPPVNVPPSANFTTNCIGLTCSFTDRSTDSDGSVNAWNWTFGDGSSSTSQNPSRTYTAAGTYTVALTATDNRGATNQYSAPVTVTSPPPTARLSDSFNRIVAAGAGVADGGTDASKTWVTWEGANADVAVDGSALVLKKDTGAWRALVGTESPANLDATVEVSAFNSDAALFGLYLRVAGGPADNYQFQWTGGALTIWRSTRTGGDVVLATMPTARNAAFKLRAQVETVGSSVVLRLKYWTGTSEPSAWTLTATDTSSARILSGGYAIRAVNGGTSDMRIDNFIVNNLTNPQP